MIRTSHSTIHSFVAGLLAWGVLAAVGLTGCGYTTRSTLPNTIRTIHIMPFKNSVSYTSGTQRNIYLPLLEVDVRNAVISRFQFDGSLRIASAETADLVLEGELTNYERSGLRFTDNDDVQEYRVQITVSLVMKDRRTGDVLWTEPDFVGEDSYFVSGPSASSEESAVDRATVDLARRIVERTIEDW